MRPLGLLPRRRVRLPGEAAANPGRVRLDRVRLPRRAHTFLLEKRGYGPRRTRLACAQFLCRHGRFGRLSQGPLLPLPEPMVDETHGPSLAALELGRAGGPTHPRHGILERAGSGIVSEGEIA